MTEMSKAKSWELRLTVKGSARRNSKGTGMVWRDNAEMPRRNGDKRVYYRRNTFKRHCFGVRELVQCDDPMLEETTDSTSCPATSMCVALNTQEVNSKGLKCLYLLLTFNNFLKRVYLTF